MVEITIIMEGGVNEMAVATSVCDNSNALREALFHVFSEALGREDVSIQSDRLRKNGKPKGVEYSKLKSASGLLSCLDVSLLVSHDIELQAFCAKVHENLPSVDI